LDQTDTNLDASTLNINLNASQENAGSSPRGSATPKLDKDVFGDHGHKHGHNHGDRNHGHGASKHDHSAPGHVRDKDEHKRELDELRTNMGQPQLKDQIRE